MNKTIETFNKALTQALYDDMKVIAIDRISEHPDDQYLCKVLVERNTDGYEPFVTYLFNGSFSSFNHGHYFNNLVDAAKDFEKRN